MNKVAITRPDQRREPRPIAGAMREAAKTDVGAAGRMLDILGVFDHEFASGTAREIASRTRISESTLFRLLRRLHQRGFLWHDQTTRRYGPGLQLLRLGDMALRQLHVPDGVKAILNELQAATEENANFSIWRGGFERSCVAVSHTALAVREFIGVGETYGLWLGASGKAIAAFLPPPLQAKIAETAFADRAQQASFLNDLRDIAQRGIAVTAGERMLEVMAASAPVFDRSAVIGSLTVSGPAFRIEPRIDAIRPHVIEKARQLSASLVGTDVKTRGESA